MKTINKALAVGVAFVIILFVGSLALSAAGPAFSSHLTNLLASAPPDGEPIPLKPISGLSSLNATVNMQVNGLIDGERAVGDLQANLTTNDQKKSQVTVTGSLLGELAAQVGGSLVGLFTPSKVDLFKVPEGNFIAIGGLLPICVKPDSTQSTAALEDLSPQALLGMFTSSEVAKGEFVGDETLNGQAVKHYQIDGEAFLAAAKKSSNPKLKAFSEALWSADDIDVYVDAKGGYPVALSGKFSGAYEPLKFEGDFAIQIELTGINKNTPVNLPASCKKPITP